MSHFRPADLHGLSRLAVEGVLGTAELVEQIHYAIARVSGPTLPSADGRTRGITGLVYRSIHGVTGLVGHSLDFGFGRILPRLDNIDSTPQRDRNLAVLNGILGDHLEASANPLALEMSLRYRNRALTPDQAVLSRQVPRPCRKIAIFLHGLCMSDRCWTPSAEQSDVRDLPSVVNTETEYLPLHLVYNSGRPISDNGRDFAEYLETLTPCWPDPIDELVLIGHSMGGLVALAACETGALAGHAWMKKAPRVITLGSPFHGAPLERIGHLVDRSLALTPFSAPFTRLGRIRSAGITDLRHGFLADRDDAVPGLAQRGLRVHALAATLDNHVESLRSNLLGDGLVPVDSALGRSSHSTGCLPLYRQRILTGVGHLELLTHPAAGRQVLDWLAEQP